MLQRVAAADRTGADPGSRAPRPTWSGFGATGLALRSSLNAGCTISHESARIIAGTRHGVP